MRKGSSKKENAPPQNTEQNTMSKQWASSHTVCAPQRERERERESRSMFITFKSISFFEDQPQTGCLSPISPPPTTLTAHSIPSIPFHPSSPSHSFPCNGATCNMRSALSLSTSSTFIWREDAAMINAENSGQNEDE